MKKLFVFKRFVTPDMENFLQYNKFGRPYFEYTEIKEEGNDYVITTPEDGNISLPKHHCYKGLHHDSKF